MAGSLGVLYDERPIDCALKAFRQALADEFKGLPEDATEENIQARIRGTLLMAMSNKFGSIVLTTGNKSEMAVGYATLYGDMAGGFAVLKDINKTLVYRLARYRNDMGRVIPERIIARAAARGVIVYPLADYYVGEPDRCGILLGYGGLEPDAVVRGARILTAVITEAASRDPSVA